MTLGSLFIDMIFVRPLLLSVASKTFLRGVSFFMGGRRVEEISGFSEYFSHPTNFSQNFFIPHQKSHENFRTPTMSESFSYPNSAVKFFHTPTMPQIFENPCSLHLLLSSIGNQTVGHAYPFCLARLKFLKSHSNEKSK